MLKDFISLVQSLNNRYKIILFCENENLYLKIFNDKIKRFKENNINVQIITFKSNISDQFKIKDTSYINFDNYDFLKVFLKLVKNKIIISSTPTINKKISNNTNYFIFVQHSLLKFSNKFTRDHINNFDKITVSSQDQETECNHLLKIDKENIIRYKYHNLEYLLKEDNKNLNNNEKPTLLIATSFYGNHLLKLVDEDLIKQISKFYKIILRPHPEIYKNQEMLKKIKYLRNKFDNDNLEISNEISNKKTIDEANYLITDFSGIGLTFSYRKLIPTVFIINDEKDKILLNENYYKNTLNQIGIIVNFNITELLRRLNDIRSNPYSYRDQIKAHKELQFRNYNQENNLENFILDQLSKII